MKGVRDRGGRLVDQPEKSSSSMLFHIFFVLLEVLFKKTHKEVESL